MTDRSHNGILLSTRSPIINYSRTIPCINHEARYECGGGQHETGIQRTERSDLSGTWLGFGRTSARTVLRPAHQIAVVVFSENSLFGSGDRH